ncbi:DUF6374 family protein [Nocardia transvalensis]|uniref:DUF6374 family protein n=1 Tax=Nocardia transvalensis TaxID=37333 RepID=UPI001895618E|nr:DUF6374 family protein [Nocardia transvalensis]MBF6330874.1 hypothetical protein [Nocardia transvalensis]
MPFQSRTEFAQLWLEQVRDRLADAAADGTYLPPEQLAILSRKVAEGLRIFIEETRGGPATACEV